ncbi:metallophosphoesterase family protein [Micromonospora endolithica]|uniref:Metallophosphoesterase n=1 Tax=Micromonospora endolithica TaxID=230091 RepID=A0A3A9YXM1_9ACTN|nr:metallophosphoesterase [Micromonospora endolithica]RKN40620.1 metallophosphoesterase [Micromonospora endolithica]TWJ21704.1 3',5'-cyclic AMP phosphodiesterase CpdA [Micromonospora endolithica]
MTRAGWDGSLLAISDLHVGHRDNRPIVEALRPETPHDWLLVAGDVAETVADVEWALGLLADRFARVVWSPGNHELWTTPGDQVRLRGVARYQHLVEVCRRLGVLTPDDPWAVWDGPGGPVTVAPLFLLYDHSWRPPGCDTPEAALAEAYRTGIVCTDERLLDPDPYPSRSAWCADRVAETARRLDERDPALPTVLVNHWPLVREPTRILRHPIFAQWCGTEATADWHRRFDAAVMVYGHLHIPRTTWYDGVRFEEVSLGYPREWRSRGVPPGQLRRILPAPDGVPPTAW